MIISAEHGDDLQEHGYIFHRDLYDVNIHVPLLILSPNENPKRISEPVSLLDIMPTVLGLLNVTIPQNIEGESLIPLLEGQSLHRSIFSERPPFNEYSIRAGKWKYILRNENKTRNAFLKYVKSVDNSAQFMYSIIINDITTGDELYDLSSDPYESINLIGKNLSVEGQLRDEILNFRNKMQKARNKNKGALTNVNGIFTYP